MSRRRSDDVERFSVQLASGASSGVEDFLQSLDDTDQVRALVECEIRHRRELGESPSLSEYATRFPQLADELGPLFEEATRTRSFSPRVPPLDDVGSPVFDRYEVREVLGEGTYGRVYRAYDPELDREVAVKWMKESAVVESFVAEAQVLARLRHPGIVAVHDVGTASDGHPYLVCELVEGGSLESRAGRGRVPVAEGCRIVAGIARALDEVHRAGVVHRDLKPANVLLDPLGSPRITDFGLAIRDAFEFDRAGEVSGSPAYMAPEQVDGRAHQLDGRTDIWALGVILYELLTGVRPFRAFTIEDLFLEIREREYKPVRQHDPQLPEVLDEVCRRCLAKQPAERYPTAADVADALDEFLTPRANVRPNPPASARHEPRVRVGGSVRLLGCATQISVTITTFLVCSRFLWPPLDAYLRSGMQDLDPDGHSGGTSEIRWFVPLLWTAGAVVVGLTFLFLLRRYAHPKAPETE